MGAGTGVLVEYSKIKKEFPEFLDVWNDTRTELVAQCTDAWGLADGGMMPGPKQFGETTIRKPFLNLGTTSGSAETWNINFSNYGWQTWIDNPTIEDVYIGLVGWMFPSATKRVAGMYCEFGQTKLPVENFEAEIQMMAEPALIYEQGIIIPEETAVKVDSLITVAGKNIIKPLGMAMCKTGVLIKKKPI